MTRRSAETKSNRKQIVLLKLDSILRRFIECSLNHHTLALVIYAMTGTIQRNIHSFIYQS